MPTPNFDSETEINPVSFENVVWMNEEQNLLFNGISPSGVICIRIHITCFSANAVLCNRRLRKNERFNGKGEGNRVRYEEITRIYSIMFLTSFCWPGGGNPGIVVFEWQVNMLRQIKDWSLFSCWKYWKKPNFLGETLVMLRISTLSSFGLSVRPWMVFTVQACLIFILFFNCNYSIMSRELHSFTHVI